MTELHFPGGSVLVDENAVWRALSAWLSATDGYGSVSLWQGGADGKFHALLVAEAGGAQFRGSSRLGVADAVAHALQVAVLEQARERDGIAGLLDDTEPLLSAARDTREPEAAE